MAISTAHEFVSMLEKSRLLTPEQLAELRKRASTVEDNPRPMIDALVQRRLLTRWQVNQILSGQPVLTIAKYKLLDKIGAGGMGTVYKAEHMQMGRIVALKLISKELLSQPDSVARFRREVHMAASLHHPNIVTAYDADEVRGRQFLVMEYVEGNNLNEWLKQHGRLPIDWASECMRQAAIGLEYAHRKGMVHRDIKPSNLLVMASGTTGVPVVKILDMGLARSAAEGLVGEEITQWDQVLGTPDYMAPEQADDSRTADIRADIYSLGCTFYKLLTGQVPFPGKTAIEKLKAAMSRPVPRVSTLRPEIPPGLDSIVARMMARDPAERFATPGEVAKALEPYASGTAGASEESSSIMLCSETQVWSPSQAHGDSALQDFLSALSGVPDQNTPAMGQTRTVVERRTPSIAPGKSGSRRKDDPRKTMLLASVAVAVVMIMIAAIWTLWPRSAVLVLQWPTNQRSDATLTIDDKPYPIDPSGLLTFELEPGAHKVAITRKGYDPVREQRTLDGGEQWIVVPQWNKELPPLPKFPKFGSTVEPTTEPTVAPKTPANRPGLKTAWVAAQNKRQKELATGLEQRLQELKTLKQDFEQQAANATAEQAAALRAKVLAFRTRWYVTDEAGQAAALLTKLPSAADALDRNKIPQHELVAAGGGSATQAPKELVGVLGDSRLNHDGVARKVAFSPDKTTVAIGTDRGTIDLWDSRTGTLIRQLKGAHANWVYALSFSPDGRWLASGGEEGAIQIWETATGEQGFRLEGHKSRVNSVAFNRDGGLLASGSFDQTVRIWDARIGDLRHELTGHTGDVVSVAFSPKQDLVASGSVDMTAKVWDASEGAIKQTLNHGNHVYGVTFVAGGDRLATAGNDGLLKFWMPQTGEELFNLTWDGGGLGYVAVNPQGDRLAVGNATKVWVRSVADGKPQWKLEMSGIYSTAFSSDGGTLGVCKHGTLRLYDVESGELRMPGPSHSSTPRGLCFSPDGTTLYSTGTDETLNVWDVARSQRKFEQRTMTGEAMAISPDGQLLGLGSANDAAIRVLQTSNGLERMALAGAGSGNFAAAFSPDNKFLATGGQDPLVRIWDLAKRSEAGQLDGPYQPVRALAYGLDGTLYAGYTNGQVYAWNVAAKQPLLDLSGHNQSITCLAVHPSGQYLASGGADGVIQIWDLRTAENVETLTIPGCALHDLAFSLDGQTLLTTSMEWTIRFWDFRAGKQLRVLRLADLQPFRMALSPEGRCLAVGLRNGCIDLLRIAER